MKELRLEAISQDLNPVALLEVLNVGSALLCDLSVIFERGNLDVMSGLVDLSWTPALDG